MNIVYITEVNGYLKKESKNLVLYKGKEKITEIKTDDLSQLIIVGNIQVSTQALSFLFKRGIDLVFLSLSGKFRGRLTSDSSKNIELRKKQFKIFEDKNFILESSRNIVRAKILNQLYFLKRAQFKRKSEKIKKAIFEIKKLLLTLEKAKSIDSIRGYEGRASALYFGVFGESIVKENIVFKKRTRRPPEDEVNTLLSFGYTLLLNTISGLVEMTSLDKYLGVFHTIDYGKPSLVLDLMEEWRPLIVDILTVSLINQGIISKKDFFYPEKDKPPYPELIEDFKELPVVLKREGLRKFITYYEKRLRETLYDKRVDRVIPYKDIIEYQVKRMVKSVETSAPYEGFFMA